MYIGSGHRYDIAICAKSRKRGGEERRGEGYRGGWEKGVGKEGGGRREGRKGEVWGGIFHCIILYVHGLI